MSFFLPFSGNFFEPAPQAAAAPPAATGTGPIGWPFCCCGGETPCPYYSDGFDRADSTTIGDSWVENAGDWSIASNKLQPVTPTANANITRAYPQIFKFEDAATARGVAYSVKCKMGSTADGDKLRLLAGNNYVVELTVGAAAELKLFYAGVEIGTACEITAAAGDTHDVEWRICFSGPILLPSYIFLYLNGTLVAFHYNTVNLVASGPGGAGGGTAGVGTGGTVTGTCTFDDFAILRHQDANEVQRVTVDATGGTFDLSDADLLVTQTLAWNASLAATQAASDAIFEAGNCTVSGAVFPRDFAFKATLSASDVGQMVTSSVNLTGGAATATVTTRGDGQDCPHCDNLCRHVWFDAVNGPDQLKLTIAPATGLQGHTGHAGDTGCNLLNSEFYLDPTCGSAAQGDIEDLRLPCNPYTTPTAPLGAPCRCFELAVNIVLHDEFTTPDLTITRIRASVSAESAPTYYIAAEFLDADGVAFMLLQFPLTHTFQCLQDVLDLVDSGCNLSQFCEPVDVGGLQATLEGVWN